MVASLTRDELNVVLALRKAGLPANAATLAVVMATREHARPEAELADIVRQYQSLETRSEAEQAIAELRRRGWLIESESYGQHFIHQAPDLRDKLAKIIDDPQTSTRLLQLRSFLEPNVRIVGPMNERVVYETYLDLLRQAQSEICLPMLATSPRLSSVSILQERSQKGVHIRILLGSPKIVAILRGETMAAMAREAIIGWKENARQFPRMQIRVVHSVEDMLIATCMTIDRQLLRFDVYDPAKQRSLQGVMLEVESPVGLRLNLVGLFQERFESAWVRAQPIHALGRIGWWLGRGWQWWAFAVFTVLAFASAKTSWSGIFASAAATFLVSALVAAWPRIHALFSKNHD